MNDEGSLRIVLHLAHTLFCAHQGQEIYEKQEQKFIGNAIVRVCLVYI
jgi:hypothetical protein